LALQIAYEEPAVHADCRKGWNCGRIRPYRLGEARLIKCLDGKTELRGGSDQDRAEVREWISLFWHEAVVREV
jgi:hypothetical protein